MNTRKQENIKIDMKNDSKNMNNNRQRRIKEKRI